MNDSMVMMVRLDAAVKAARKHMAKAHGTRKVVEDMTREFLKEKAKFKERDFVSVYVIQAASAGCTGNTVELGRLAWKKLQEITE